jgi:hypothetical protein
VRLLSPHDQFDCRQRRVRVVRVRRWRRPRLGSFSGDHPPPDIGNSHPDNSDPPRTGAHRSRLYGRQPVAHEAVQRRVREAVSQHVGHGAAMGGRRLAC